MGEILQLVWCNLPTGRGVTMEPLSVFDRKFSSYEITSIREKWRRAQAITVSIL